MINLLGCSKDNFVKLLKLMNYKVKKGEKENEIYFSYMPRNTNNEKKILKKNKKNDNPFNVLTSVNYN